MSVLFSCHELIKTIRPRIFTLEQTFGIMHNRFEVYLNALIYSFTQYGYSIRWKAVFLWNWGLPAKRQRLIMIGSCPGEPLPPFPPSTHVEDPQPGDGTKPFVTVAQALSKISVPLRAVRANRDPLHDLDSVKWLNVPQPPWSPHVPLSRTITCSGGVGNYHFLGYRDFTRREYATLQGFPVKYPFKQNGAKKQIGNAFPPCVVKVLMMHIRQWLEHVDQVQPNGEIDEMRWESAEDVIVIPDDYGEGDEEVQYLGLNPLTSPSSQSSGTSRGSDDCWDSMDVDDDGWWGHQGESPEGFGFEFAFGCIDADQSDCIINPTGIERVIDLTGVD
ncbi:S-adenosyl-L-methionine-dependent methyltransferase [Pseudomassariella vexata]|uniref:DNA (cytosine-5-)-methyltransferase n=1 Tax=Pseudomassariella vexata TaxID=1141098 RepID=A0A1Y2DQT5_9PEZI|nr:S-adenosyl-L-methionine-dependent methyltransferase [Pseudomassariella vexata]ORY61653.1 S-adenosyl-L-methionine-dependent methyltransferase [Pseudomassariella vexata]